SSAQAADGIRDRNVTGVQPCALPISPKYNVEECKARDATYAAPIKVRVRLRNQETEEIKEQEIFLGDFPLMTKAGTFVINGAEQIGSASCRASRYLHVVVVLLTTKYS